MLITSAYGISIDKVIHGPNFIEVVPRECETVENGIDMCNYITNDELKRQIKNLHDKYSSQNLIKIGTIGKSVQGEDLTYLKITSNVNSTRPLLKPMFK
mgnify:CR=1 FL=1